MSLSRGRDHLAIPGPSIMPDRVLRAMHRAAPNIYEGELIELTASVIADLKRVARTTGDCAVYIGNGHAAWEAAIANLLRPGDRALALGTGRFAQGWAEMAGQMGVDAEVLDFGFRAPADPARIEDALRQDRTHSIRAVLCVQTDTASSVRSDVAAVRAAIDAAGHPALLVVDCIASLACEPYEMDAWGADVTVAACQKGLMTPPGVAFTFHGPRAAAERVACPSPYWNWGPRIDPDYYYKLFCGTAPTHHLYGLREALDMILAEEGLEAVWARHTALAAAVWAAVDTWAGAGEIAANISDTEHRSHAVTSVRTNPGAAPALRSWCAAQGLTLGIGLPGPGADADGLFRIGHMGHLNPTMLLGALATLEAGFAATGIAHTPGGAMAAGRLLATGPEQRAAAAVEACAGPSG